MASRVRMTTVESVIGLSPHMRRIVLGGHELNDFPESQESAHVKVIIPDPKEIRPSLGLLSKHKKNMRSYTIRNFDSASKQMTIDFAVNDHEGNIANWAKNAKPGDSLAIAGPGSVKHTSLSALWHLFVGDLTSLPAIAATIERLPNEAQGQAFIQIPSEADKQVFKKPDNVKINWIIAPYRGPTLLVNEVLGMSWPQVSPAIFLAAEAEVVKILKEYFGKQDNMNKSLMYSAAYWNIKK